MHSEVGTMKKGALKIFREMYLKGDELRRNSL
jgi:hypothetical protein